MTEQHVEDAPCVVCGASEDQCWEMSGCCEACDATTGHTHIHEKGDQDG